LTGNYPARIRTWTKRAKTAGLAPQETDAQALPADQELGLLTGCTDRAELPSDLVRLIDAWPKLPDHIRRAILTLADGCK
jgi:hypothetical protein